ncbi:hypothetical protein TanjilG_25134 [Lupinus angustifolius]|uniref:Uncharacterized protein n=1 Tax=Lupinus angustifolius TaxID=3871 RepID=A0A1J7G4E1_LUPAN|nr:hypothetical protein TanjilG_25134 [Lupinus angustifolius]
MDNADGVKDQENILGFGGVFSGVGNNNGVPLEGLGNDVMGNGFGVGGAGGLGGSSRAGGLSGPGEIIGLGGGGLGGLGGGDAGAGGTLPLP